MLTEMQVKNAKARERDYKLADSEGLYLYVTARGHRSWRMKYRFAGKERRLVLGAYPDLGLREARDRKVDARKLLREGRDPGIEAVKARVERTVASANTFEALARGWYALQERLP
ncbi:Arm DNA-binding domain-containing protein [Novosphingobium sp. B 225]|uniref:Arm DNA-binding domain-containing protein n=1 Tax=Novosphingobium sp. B 225 TaxID=1961849 RepID=UPI000B4B8FC1|nr:Arm DNA-binding domain-containing protein [Novosphingobium sp. B 225]